MIIFIMLTIIMIQVILEIIVKGIIFTLFNQLSHQREQARIACLLGPNCPIEREGQVYGIQLNHLASKRLRKKALVNYILNINNKYDNNNDDKKPSDNKNKKIKNNKNHTNSNNNNHNHNHNHANTKIDNLKK